MSEPNPKGSVAQPDPEQNKPKPLEQNNVEPDNAEALPAPNKRPRWRLLLCALLAGLLLAAAYAAFDAWRFLNTTAADYFEETPKTYVLRIEQGTTFDRVAWQIYNEKGLSSVWRFRLLASWHKAMGSIQAGDFELNNAWTPAQVLQQLVSGKPLFFPLTIKEGLPWWEIAALVEAKGFARAEDFEEAIHNTAFLQHYGIPFANAEGFLFPETYHLRKPRQLDKEQAGQLAALLVETFWRKTAPLWVDQALSNTNTPQEEQMGDKEKTPPAKNTQEAGTQEEDQPGAPKASAVLSPLVPPWAAQSPQEVKRLLILASLVEKESALTRERPTIAGVYANRLRFNMLLQCDPTIIYGLGKKYTGKILRSQIDDPKNLYNTYQHAGLPPGPICSPGLESLRAAFYPEAHSYLYFVASGQADGSHTFSRNINDHNRAVGVYRRSIRER